MDVDYFWFLVVLPCSDLAAERRQLSASLQKSQQLASDVDSLGAQLDQVHGEKQKVCPIWTFCFY